MYKCMFCGFESDSMDDFEEDFTSQNGFWCCYCDGFTPFAENKRNSFFLLLEDPEKEETPKIERRISRNIPSQVSPLRYPGGKSKVIDQILTYCNQKNFEKWVEPYAGGASVGLALLLAGYVKELYLNDIDKGVYALFKVICSDPEPLLYEIKHFRPSREAYEQAQKRMFTDYEGLDLQKIAITMLIVNRLSFSGICRANCMSNPAARWNPETLIRRINQIHSCAEHIHVSCCDAPQYIEEMYWERETTIFIDPPYFKKGKQLYKHYYNRVDHDNLAFLLNELYKGMPGADIIVTYDYAEYIQNIYTWPQEFLVGRNYSISNGQ